MSQVIRLIPPIWFHTPMGEALASFMIDHGLEMETEWVCFHKDGAIRSWMNYDIRVARNATMGRDEISPIDRRVNMAKRYEGSAADIAKDKREAKKRGMTMKQWERSAADKKMDRAGAKRMSKKGR